MPPEKRPQDPHLDGRDLKFETLEHGGAVFAPRGALHCRPS
jgi:hypothetical protein